MKDYTNELRPASQRISESANQRGYTVTRLNKNSFRIPKSRKALVVSANKISRLPNPKKNSDYLDSAHIGSLRLHCMAIYKGSKFQIYIKSGLLRPILGQCFERAKESGPAGSCGPTEGTSSCMEQRTPDAGVCDRKRSSKNMTHHAQYTSRLTLASSSFEKLNSPQFVNQLGL